jgi:FkbM family methyltransferase
MAARHQTLFHTVRAIVHPRYQANWIAGRRKADGFVWYVRGTNFPMTHEDWLRSLVNPFKGNLFVDIGAHIGTWALRATRSFQKVIAFEPNPKTNMILRTNVKLNKLANIMVIEAAISNTTGEIPVASGSRNEKKAEFRVPIRTLDSYKLTPSLVKIDTEGNELHVLQGAQETLKQKPQLVIETHSQESVGRIQALLKSYEYSIREIRRQNRFNQLQSWLLSN